MILIVFNIFPFWSFLTIFDHCWSFFSTILIMFDQIVQNIFNLVFSPTSVPSSWSFWQILACFRMPPTFSTAFKGMSAKAKATKVINPKHHHLVTPENAYIANTAVNYQEKSPRPSLTTSKNRKPILKGGLFMSFICTVFENHRKKSHLRLRATELRLHFEWTKVH